MNKYWKQFTTWCNRKWIRFKRWTYSILVSIGLVAGTVLAATTTITWVMPTERVDGTPLPIEEIVETRIYCDGDSDPTHIEAAPNTSALVILGFGSHTCDATVVDIYALQSDRSNQITIMVAPVSLPNPPIMTGD